ncbi:TolB family protein [Micromonospora sp. NPDC051300]|uniref:TolB family protein n=1 Tax=Micromonospora sp. NPDC051300 TaxID=3364286 RepID=UPI0037BA639A
MVVLGTALSLTAVPAPAGAAPARQPDPATTRISVSSDRAQANERSSSSSSSRTGRWVSFASRASNLVPGDTNGVVDVFVRDRVAATIVRVSVPAGGGQGNGDSTVPSISQDGRYVAFSSFASNLVPGDTNGFPDLFVRDLLRGTTSRVSVPATGGQDNGPSGFSSSTISGDGRWVIFESTASNLVPGDTNDAPDVFLRDLRRAVTSRVSVSSTGAQGYGVSSDPAISADGRYAAFSSWSSNLVPGDTNGVDDVFVRDLAAGVTRRVSVAAGGVQANRGSSQPAISGDGRRVAFVSGSTNLVPGDTNGTEDVFLTRWSTGTTTRLSVSAEGAQADSFSNDPSIDHRGRYVSFTSYASNLVPGDTNDMLDVFVADAG